VFVHQTSLDDDGLDLVIDHGRKGGVEFRAGGDHERHDLDVQGFSGEPDVFDQRLGEWICRI